MSLLRHYPEHVTLCSRA